MHCFVLALKNYAQFTGRAQRSEYWCVYLLLIALYPIVVVLNVAVMYTIGHNIYGGVVFVLLMLVSFLLMLVPSISVFVRRLHDIGHSGWWALTAFIPFVGFIPWIYVGLQDSQPGPNQYGPSPKENVE